jgi:hypothetical protein
MGIFHLKERMRDVPGIESLTMTMVAGEQRYTLNGRDIVVPSSASDFDVEKAIRAAITSAAVAQIPVAPDPATPVGAGAVQAAVDAPAAPTATPLPPVTINAPANAPAPSSPGVAPVSSPASVGLTVKAMMEEHTRLMGDIHAAQLEILRATLNQQRNSVATSVGNVAAKIAAQTDEFNAIMGQFANDLGGI